MSGETSLVEELLPYILIVAGTLTLAAFFWLAVLRNQRRWKRHCEARKDVLAQRGQNIDEFVRQFEAEYPELAKDVRQT